MQSSVVIQDSSRFDGRDERGRFLRGCRHVVDESCRRPALGRTWHVTESRWDSCKECGAFCEMWGRQRYCSRRCRQRVNMRNYRSRKRGTPGERRRYRFKTIPEGLHVVKRPYVDDIGAPPWWEQPDPGRAILVPLTPELEDALTRVAAPSGFPKPSRYCTQATIRYTAVSQWDSILHDLLMGALRRLDAQKAKVAGRGRRP